MAVFDRGVQAQHEWPAYAGARRRQRTSRSGALVLPHADEPMRRADFDAAISDALDELFAQDPGAYRSARALGDELRAELRTPIGGGSVRGPSDLATRPEGRDSSTHQANRYKTGSSAITTAVLTPRSGGRR